MSAQMTGSGIGHLDGVRRDATTALACSKHLVSDRPDSDMCLHVTILLCHAAFQERLARRICGIRATRIFKEGYHLTTGRHRSDLSALLNTMQRDRMTHSTP